MSSNQRLERLEQILREEFQVLTQGDFSRLGELLCEKLHLVESLGQEEMEPRLLKRCRRLNRELLSAFGPQPGKARATYTRP